MSNPDLDALIESDWLDAMTDEEFADHLRRLGDHVAAGEWIKGARTP